MDGAIGEQRCQKLFGRRGGGAQTRGKEGGIGTLGHRTGHRKGIGECARRQAVAGRGSAPLLADLASTWRRFPAIVRHV